MSSPCPLTIARKKLNDALGDDFKKYLQNMKLWFRQKITKEQFDAEACRTLNPEAIRLHNEFFLAVLDKCQSISAPPAQKENAAGSQCQSPDKLKKSAHMKKKVRPNRPTFEHRFQPADPQRYLPVSAGVPDASRVGFCAREALLPDLATVHGRMMVTAWDFGLEAVAMEAVSLVAEAVHFFMKSLLLRVLTHRKAYKLRDGKFPYAVGCPPPNIYLRSQALKSLLESSHRLEVTESGELAPPLPPTPAFVEAQQAGELARCVPLLPARPLSLHDLFSALKVHRSAIPSHTVYSINMERIIARMEQPVSEEPG